MTFADDARWWKAGAALDKARERVTAEAVDAWLREHSPEGVGCSMRDSARVASFYRSRAEDRIEAAVDAMRGALEEAVREHDLREWERMEAIRRVLKARRTFGRSEP